MKRAEFREQVFERDDGTCTVPTCSEDAVDAHHIIERSLWESGGYIPNNGASVCETHHKFAEENIIPPQAFWRWVGVEDPPLPDSVDTSDIDKWGKQLQVPPWREHRERIKYPSTRHLPWSHERDDDDTAHEAVECFTDVPLVATVKMDGGNAMLVKDDENPIRARNGKHADKDHFDMAKQWYWENNLYEKIPDHLQIFGEWLYAKHSIHYGCDCDEECEDTAPPLCDYFQVFGVYDTRYDLWLGWHETVGVADRLGLTLVPPAASVERSPDSVSGYTLGRFERTDQFWEYFYDLSQRVVDDGHEGIVVRSAHPFHYSQIDKRLGKYVRPNHVKEGETHWSKRPIVQNRKT